MSRFQGNLVIFRIGITGLEPVMTLNQPALKALRTKVGTGFVSTQCSNFIMIDHLSALTWIPCQCGMI